MRTYYEVLGVSADAPADAIRQTYLRLLQIYHPDHNRDPQAHKFTVELVEAYSVIGDPHRRAAYDRSRRSGTEPAEGVPKAKPHQAANPSIENIVCQQCGVQDASLRIASMTWVASLVFITKRGTRGGIWCVRCRSKQAAVWSTITGLFGWWGFPWGLIYTPRALYDNAKGGKQDKGPNANLLRVVGFQLFQAAQYSEAHAALEASLAFEPDAPTQGFKASVPPAANVNATSQRFVSAMTAVPSVFSTAIVVVCLILYVNRPSGYAARYQQEQKDQAVVQANSGSQGAKEKVNELAGQLGAAVEANATPVGSHQEGTTTIHDYQLDRSKYQAEVFSNISQQIEPFLNDPNANAGGFASSAYFNARLMAASISILNGFDEGQDVSEQVEEIDGLGADTRISGWLLGSRYSGPYYSLLPLLHKLANQRSQGMSSLERRSQLEALKSQIEDSESKIRVARTDSDAVSEHALVEAHNRFVQQYNGLVKAGKRNSVLYAKADLAFNKCLDPAILMDKFQQVSLTKGGDAVNAMLEP